MDEAQVKKSYKLTLKDLKGGMLTTESVQRLIKNCEREEKYEACAGMKKALDDFFTFKSQNSKMFINKPQL